MDIQVLNEIANLARQASLSKVSTSVSANAQLKGLKGNPVPVPGSPVLPLIEGSLEQTPVPVTPDISTVARAASAYSATVGDELNSDELIAIQDLAGKVRTAVSDFLSQPGLEQAENAAALVATNPEAVQDFTSSVKQAVVDTLNLPESEGELNVHATTPNVSVPEEVTVPEDFISLERITNGAEINHQAQVVAANPAQVHSRASENTNVENLVSRPEAVAFSQQDQASHSETLPASPQDTPVIPASPAVQNANVLSRVVEDPANTVNAPEISSGDFTVTAASPALQNAQAGDHARAETPVNRSDAVASPQQETASQLETVPVNPQGTPVVAASSTRVHSRASENTSIENPFVVEEGVEASNRDFRITPANRSDAVASPQQESVSRPETVQASPQETPVIPASPDLQNAQAQNPAVVNPVSSPSPKVNQGQRPEEARPVNFEGSVASSTGASSPQVSEHSNSQPASAPEPRPAQSSELFAREHAAVKPGNIRNVDELVNSVVDSEFTSEAKKIFSEPKVIRTVADLADFILERLREIIAIQQQKSQSSGEFGLS